MFQLNKIPPEKSDKLNLSPQQQIKVQIFKEWVEKESSFYGRTDEAYLLLFLYAFNFDVKLSKQKMTNYYEIRAKYPEWYSNRDIKSPELSLIYQQRIGNDASKMNALLKYLGIVFEVVAKRRNCQSNGYIPIADFRDCPWWIIFKALWPPLIKSCMQNILLCPPIQFQKLIVLNVPSICSKVLSGAQYFVPNAFFNKIVCCDDWSQIGKFVPLDLLPEEYGGSAGQYKQHEDAFMKELMEFNEELLEDNKYGFRK